MFVCRPEGRRPTEEPCARKILSTLATRAYRRPVTEDDLQTLLDVLPGRAVRKTDFDAGIQRGLERILAAPSFLFRIEREPATLPAGSAYRLSDLDLASRLSFFLWSSIPDDELLDAAVRGKLNDPAVLEQQVRRMLRDPRSKRARRQFRQPLARAEQDRRASCPTPSCIREFDENLRDAMEQETKLFVGSQLRDDRSVLELLTADYTFLNERLARHYGIPNVYGSHFRRVTFADGRRGGLLGQASLLTVTSYPNRTSVDAARQVAAREPARRAAAAAAGRHAGAQGRRRRRPAAVAPRADGDAPEESGVRVVPSAHGSARVRAREFRRARTMAHGERRRADRRVGVVARRHAVRRRRRACARCWSSHKEDFVRTLTGKLLAYALGRGLDYHDMPAVRKIARDAAPARLLLVVDHRRHRQQHAVQHGGRSGQSGPAIMRGRNDRRKKAIPRRTVLRGMGPTLALPLLDSMVPALSALREDRRQADQPLRRHVRAERHDHEELPAADAKARLTSSRRR